MNFSPPKIFLIVTLIVFTLLQSAMSSGQEAVSNLKGQWLGNGLLSATTSGFSESTDTIKINIYEQEDLKFKGKIEINHNGNISLQDIQGYLGRNKYNLCLVDQKNKTVIVGHVTSRQSMKLYYWANRESDEIAVYILRKKKK